LLSVGKKLNDWWDQWKKGHEAIIDGFKIGWQVVKFIVFSVVLCWMASRVFKGFARPQLVDLIVGPLGLILGLMVTHAFVGALMRVTEEKSYASVLINGEQRELPVEVEGFEKTFVIGDFIAMASSLFGAGSTAQSFRGFGEALPKFVSIGKSVEWIFSKARLIIGYAYTAYTGKPFATTFIEREIMEVVADLQKAEASKDSFGGWTSLFTEKAMSFDEMHALLARFDAVKGRARSASQYVHQLISQELSSKDKVAQEMRTSFEEWQRSAVPRHVPVWISLVGQPGVGKSTRVKEISKKFYEGVKKKYPQDARYGSPFTANSMYRMTPDEEWFDAYHGQPIVGYEEIFQALAVETRAKQALFLMAFVSSEPMVLATADLKMKGMRHMNADMFITTRNVVQLTNIGLCSPGALVDRQTFLVELIPCDQEGCETRGVMCDEHRMYKFVSRQQGVRPLSCMINGEEKTAVTEDQLVDLAIAAHVSYRKTPQLATSVYKPTDAVYSFQGPRLKFGPHVGQLPEVQALPAAEVPGRLIVQEMLRVKRVVIEDEVELEDLEKIDSTIFPGFEKQVDTLCQSTVCRRFFNTIALELSTDLLEVYKRVVPMLPALRLTGFNEQILHMYSTQQRADAEDLVREYSETGFLRQSPTFMKSIGVGVEQLQSFPTNEEFAASVAADASHFYEFPMEFFPTWNVGSTDVFSTIGTRGEVVRNIAVYIGMIAAIAAVIAFAVVLLRHVINYFYKIEEESGRFGNDGQVRQTSRMPVGRLKAVRFNLRKSEPPAKQSGSVIAEVILGNIKMMRFGDITNYALGIYKNLYVTTTHSVEEMTPDSVVTVNSQMQGSAKEFYWGQSEQWQVATAEGLVFFTAPGLDFVKDIRSWIASEEIAGCKIARLTPYVKPGDGIGLRNFVERHETRHWSWNPVQRLKIDGVAQDMPGGYGKCGLPYFTVDKRGSEQSVIGIHGAGTPGENVSYFHRLDMRIVGAVTLEYEQKHPDVPSVAHRFPIQQEGMVHTPGTMAVCLMPVRARLPNHTRLLMTEFHPDSVLFDRSLSFGHVPTRVPVKFKGELNPLSRTLAKYGTVKPYTDEARLNVTPPFDVSLLDTISFEKLVPKTFSRNALRLLTYEEAIVGAPGFSGLDLTKSAGFPYSTQGKGRSSVLFTKDFQLRPEFLLECQMLEEQLADDIVPAVFIDSLKDELLPHEDVAKGKLRVFCTGELTYLVLTNRYFASLLQEMEKEPYATPIAIGLNPHSAQWGLLYDRLKGKTKQGEQVRTMAGDFSGFEFTLPSHYFDQFVRFCDTVYPLEEKQRTIRRNLVYSLVRCYHLLMNRLYFTEKGTSSGNGLTAFLNSFINWLHHVFGFLKLGYSQLEFERNVEVTMVGDDVVATVSEKYPDYDMFYLVKFSEQAGMHYTASDKGVIKQPYLDLCEVDFLKRRFVVSKDGSWVYAPLRVASILEAPMWRWDKSDGLSDMENTLRSVLVEARHYGEHMYNRCLIVIKSWQRTNNSRVLFDTFQASHGKLLLCECKEGEFSFEAQGVQQDV